MRVRFRIVSITEHLGDTRSMRLVPINAWNETSEQSMFLHAPSGDFHLRDLRPEALDGLVIGGEYEFDFAPSVKA